MAMTTDDEIRTSVRKRYAQSAMNSEPCCGGSEQASCCSPGSTHFGYSAAELASLPEGADLSLGCGNPTGIASLREGETVLDLGSGAGIDCFLASVRVGASGSVIGVDMTPEMLTRARENARKGGYENVEFRLGEIENLPVANDTVDVVISNCVVNLSPEKGRVFAEAYRVLKPGGRVMVSDLVLAGPLPERLRGNQELLTGCITGAMPKDEYLEAIRSAGFASVQVESESAYVKYEHLSGLAREAGIDDEATRIIADTVLSVTVSARK
jgi:SAM-dependent methyltransferase